MMQPKSKRNITILIIVGVVIAVITAVLVLFQNQTEDESVFELKSTTPSIGSELSPVNARVVFEFNKDLPIKQPDSFFISVSPEVDFVYGILGNKLSINLSGLLVKPTEQYRVYVSTVTSNDGDALSNIQTDFVIKLDDKAIDFIESLPKSFDGYRISIVSNESIYVSVNKKPYDENRQNALNRLNKLGLSPTLFDVGVSDATGSFSPQPVIVPH